ncbi:type I restriction endonuclease subunit S [Weissella paramesenteroides]|nr:type I restriction endonuclease subunit S [Weissella paramesenteroides]KAA8437380.1 type I restriction endonuclease subunit S [Weissella paramesenteroides]
MMDVNSGRDYKHLKKGNIPVYGTGGYMLSVDESLSNEDGIGIGRKGTINMPYILHAPYWTVDTLFYTIPNKEYDLNFIFILFQITNWKKYDESTGVPSLSKKTINNIEKRIPDFSEQRKVGIFFQTFDNLITVNQRPPPPYFSSAVIYLYAVIFTFIPTKPV